MACNAGEMASSFHRAGGIKISWGKEVGDPRTVVRGQRTEIGGQGSRDYADFHRLKKMRDERTEVGEQQKSEVGSRGRPGVRGRGKIDVTPLKCASPKSSL